MPQGRPMLYACLGLLALLGLCALPMTDAGAAPGDKPVVVLETSMGTISIELDPAKAPATVENFLKYVDAGFYNGTVFHRVIGPNDRQPMGFMIQGGGFTEDLKEKETRPPVKNESRAVSPEALGNARGTIAMARTSDVNSATAQFFINLGDNSFLDRGNGGYTSFGKVTEGMDIVDAIAKVPTGSKMLQGQPAQDVPQKSVIIKGARRKSAS